MNYVNSIWPPLLASLALVTTGCSDDDSGSNSGISTTVEILNAEDLSMTLGTAMFTLREGGEVVADFNIAANDIISGGQHAIHIHENGSCDAADTDNDGVPEPAGAAGGHFNPTNVGHGEDNGPHAGDSTEYNYTFNDDGSFTGEVTFNTAGLFGQNPMLIDGGTAVIIHAGVDDAYTDPSGNAGPRIACGVIVP